MISHTVSSSIVLVKTLPRVEVEGEERRDGARLACEGSDPAFLADGLRRIVAAGIPVIEFRREQRRLEEAFVDMVKDRR
jgi:ABC-2 type transport system ATP-binding protein